MFLFNLSLGQFLALFGSASAIVVALYLFDRSRRRQRVSTLQFWQAAEHPVTASRRTRIQQPWSLILQLLGIGLLLLAIAQPRWGSIGATPFDHVLLLDASAWTGARAAGRSGQPLIEEVRARARSYVESLPSADRVMVVRADALATPVTAFEENRKRIDAAIGSIQPGSTALNLEQALDFARQAQTMAARRPGEITLVGPGRIAGRETLTGSGTIPPNVRYISVPQPGPNIGLRKIGLRKPAASPAQWDVFVAVRNYSAAPRLVNLGLLFDRAPVGSRQLSLPPGGEQEAVFRVNTVAAGLLEARLMVRDAFPDDDVAILELPRQRIISVAVYSDAPESLRPVLEASPQVKAAFYPPSAYTPKPEADLIILDGVAPSSPPQLNTVWIDPPPGVSAVPVRERVQNAPLTRWLSDHPLGEGLRTKDMKLASASLLQAGPGDIRVAETPSGPVVVARQTSTKQIVIGFSPTRSAMRYELATPLLFANILRWMSPDVFRQWEISGGSVGSINSHLDADVKPSEIKVLDEEGRPLPFTVHDGVVSFFAGVPGSVRLVAGHRERVYSLTLPELGETAWQAPPGVRRGIPPRAVGLAAAADFWHWLAIAGAALLVLEWFLYGRFRRGASPGRLRLFRNLRILSSEPISTGDRRRR